MTPTKDQALQFALLLQSGMPSNEAIRYFLPPDEPNIDPRAIVALHDAWMKSSALKFAFQEVQGKPWQDLSPEQRIKTAIDKHYNELAYFIYSRNYCEVTGSDLTKLNAARAVLETKLAGLAGQSDPLTRFWNDLASGKVKLSPARAPVVLPAS